MDESCSGGAFQSINIHHQLCCSPLLRPEVTQVILVLPPGGGGGGGADSTVGSGELTTRQTHGHVLLCLHQLKTLLLSSLAHYFSATRLANLPGAVK